MPGTIALSSATYSIGEAGPSVTITATRNGGSDGTVGISYATSDGTAAAGLDYTTTSGTLSWVAGDTANKTFTVPVTNDTVYEGNETFTVTLSGPTGGAPLGTPSSATVTITDNEIQPTVQFSAAAANASEATTPAPCTVTLSGASAQTVTVNYATADGTATAGSDYTAKSGTLTFNPGVTSLPIDVTVINDTNVEPNETFMVTISAPSNATLGTPTTHTYTINNDDAAAAGTLQFTAATFTQAENVATANLTVSRTGGSAGAVSVQCANAGTGTATLTDDYTMTSPQTLNWADGGTATQNCVVAIANDTLDENGETVNAQLQSATGGASIGAQSTTALTITDDDNPPTVQFSAATSSGSEATTAVTIPVMLSTASGLTVTVNYATANGTATAGSDYTSASGTLTFNPGVTSQNINVTVTNDTSVETDETFTATISAPSNASLGGQTSHIYTILNDDSPACTRNAPTFTISPATQNVKTNASAGYALYIKNNDSAECADTITFNIGKADSGATGVLSSALSGTSVDLTAGAESSAITLTVTSTVAAVDGNALTTQLTLTDAPDVHADVVKSVTTTVANFNPMIHSSLSTNSTKWGGNWGTSQVGSKYGEFTCATCHVKNAAPNIKRVKPSVSTPDASNWAGPGIPSVAVSFQAVTGANSFGDDGRAPLTSSTMVCEACHSLTSVHRYDSSGVVDTNHMSANLTDCLGCHPHNKGFDASCTTCHGNPPVDGATLVAGTLDTGSATAGAHQAHTAASIACALCHSASVGSGARHNVDAKVTLGFVNLPTGTGGSSAGSYSGQTGVAYDTTHVGTTVGPNDGLMTCANYCHGNTLGGSGAKWNDPATGECGDCHAAAKATVGNAATGLPSDKSHKTHAETKNLDCSNCHGAAYVSGISAAVGHLNGKVWFDVAALGGTVTYKGTANGDIANLAPSASYGKCTNVACHFNTTTPDWNSSVTCASCHASPPATGAHAAHFVAKGWTSPAGDGTDCAICHPTDHDGTVEVNAGLTPAGSGGTTTCASTPAGCHNGRTTPQWSTINIACADCHTIDGTNSATVANPVSGLHGNTVASVRDHDSTLDNAATVGISGCEECHVKASIGGHWNGTASATADYTKAQVGITATWYTDASGTGATRGSCYSPSPATGLDGCHSDGGEWRRQWSINADADITASKLPGQAVCNVCHGQYSSLAASTGWNEGTVHYRSSDLADRTTEDKGIIHADAGDECEDCHGYDSVAVHNSNNKIDFSDSGNPGGYAVTLNTTPNPDVWYCATCHTSQNAQVATLTGSHTFLDSLAFPNSTNPINHVVGTSTPQGSCFGCHGDGTAEYWPQLAGNVRGSTTMADYNNAGKHQKHMEVLAARLGYTLPGDDTQQKAMCDYCHTVADGDHMTTGAAQLAEVFPIGSAKNLWNGADGDVAFNTTNYNCTASDCHNSKDTTTTYSWYSASTSTCTMCHTRAISGSNPSSGLHYGGTAPTVSGEWHDDTLTGATNGCAHCHSALPTIGNTAASTHFDGVFQGGNGQKTQMGLFATYTQTADNVGTCATTCHNGAGDNGTWARRWDAAIHYDPTDADYVECAGCHGGFANDWTFGTAANITDGSVEHNRNWDGDATTSEVIGNHSNNTDKKCNICHVYGDAAYVWGTQHRNGSITMNSTVGYQRTTTTPNYGCASTCHSSNTNHGLENSNWTLGTLAGPALTCTSCHAGTGTGALKVGSTSPHVIRGTKAGMNIFNACEDCHPSTKHNGIASGKVFIAENTTVGINFTAVLNGAGTADDEHTNDGGTTTGFWLGGSATTGTTEAEICWNCHSNTTTYQTTAISEWGTNTKQASAPAPLAAFNYGTVSTPNWTTATWTSPQAGFAYKTGAIQSTHSVNNAGTSTVTATAGYFSETKDSVANIRCSYCHDVHDTASGVVAGDVSGKPFLRGSWWTNPYKEDGAPTGAYNAYSTTPVYGAVPRGYSATPSTNATAYGGWQIDQNNNNPTVSTGYTGVNWTYANSAGLCALCHTSTVNGMNWNATENGGASLWVGTNGHNNAVIGGTGTSAANIYNPTTRNEGTTVTNPKMGYQLGDTARQYGLRNNNGNANDTSDGTTYIGATADGVGVYPYAGVGATAQVRYAYQTSTGAGNTGVWGVDQSTTTAQTQYHKFSCSKCHNPHASRLPKLMITNCLDVSHNTWDDKFINDGDWTGGNQTWSTVGIFPTGTETAGNNKEFAYAKSAQNCHRFIDNNGNGTITTGDAGGDEPGWNKVTPWK